MAADLDMYIMAVDSAARARDEERLNKYLPAAEESAARANHVLYIAVARRARGVAHQMAGEFDAAAEQLTEAADEFRSLNTPWQIGQTLLELGEVELSREDRAAASSRFAEALNAFEALGAVPDAARARSALGAM